MLMGKVGSEFSQAASASDKETRDRAERGNAVRGSARASVAAEENSLPTFQNSNLERETGRQKEAPVSGGLY
jgi:hypothetical protein